MTPTLRAPSSALGAQILDFIEPTTGVRVKLVGSMHYNPASIKLATDSIDELAANDELGSVIIESCDLRWNATLEGNEFIQNALMSEMRAAHDLTLEYGRPVVLGDQRINITVAKLGDGAKETALDLLRPIEGWKRVFNTITEARKEAVPFGENYLGPGAFFDPKLILAAPVSLLKYPASYFIRSPLITTAVFVTLVALGNVEASNAYALDSATTSDTAVSLLVSALETIVFARIFMKELLAERNEVLAENILEQCKNYKAKSGWEFFPVGRGGSDNTVYAPGSTRPKLEEGKVVVAVLGLAHLNGIKKIMMEKTA